MLSALFDVLKKGSSVANPEAWKRGQITADVLAAFLVSIAAFGKALGIPQAILDFATPEVLLGVATFIVGVVSPALTVATTKKIGVGESRYERF